jgi:hypothetical protein
MGNRKLVCGTNHDYLYAEHKNSPWNKSQLHTWGRKFKFVEQITTTMNKQKWTKEDHGRNQILGKKNKSSLQSEQKLSPENIPQQQVD